MSQKSSRTGLKSYLHDFAVSTSVRGIPRAAKADDNALFVLWTTAVTLCSAVLLWNLFVMFSRYYSYQVVTNIKEADYNVVRNEHAFLIVFRMIS
jgi:hypothetical protein